MHTTPSVAHLWKILAAGTINKDGVRHRAARAMRAHAELLKHYEYLVNNNAHRYTPRRMETGDLISEGLLGLVKAIDSFDPSRNVKFETYAIKMVKGAILEFLRQDDWVPRSVRSAVKDYEKEECGLLSENGRQPTPDEVVNALGLSEKESRRLLFDKARVNVVSLDDPVSGDGLLHVSDTLPDDRVSVADTCLNTLRDEQLYIALEKLPSRERFVLQKYYDSDESFNTISKVLAVSGSRVYQIHGQAMTHLRKILTQHNALFT